MYKVWSIDFSFGLEKHISHDEYDESCMWFIFVVVYAYVTAHNGEINKWIKKRQQCNKHELDVACGMSKCGANITRHT